MVERNDEQFNAKLSVKYSQVSNPRIEDPGDGTSVMSFANTVSRKVSPDLSPDQDGNTARAMPSASSTNADMLPSHDLRKIDEALNRSKIARLTKASTVDDVIHTTLKVQDKALDILYDEWIQKLKDAQVSANSPPLNLSLIHI